MQANNSMDEINFNASLDALLDSEHLHAEGGGSPQHDSMPMVDPGADTTKQQQQQQQQQFSQQMFSQIPTMGCIPSQGLLTSSGSNVAAPGAYMQYAMPTGAAPVPQAQQQQQQHAGLSATATTTAYGYPPMQQQQQQQQQRQQQTAGGPPNTASVAPRNIGMASTVSLGSKSTRRGTKRRHNNNNNSSNNASSTKTPPSSASIDSTMLPSKHQNAASSMTEVSEDEGDREKRRQDRNMREQQRSQKITHQIAELREVLEEANIEFKPDKYSTLVTIADYIKDLQAKSSQLDVEHKTLLETISKTNELVNQQYAPNNVDSSDSQSSPDAANVSPLAEASHEMLAANGIDYKGVFVKCGIPLAVASVDGRFMDCNQAFQNFTGLKRSELLPAEVLAAEAAEAAATAAAANTPAEVNASPSIFPEQVLSLLPPPPKQQRQMSSAPQECETLSLFNILHREDMERVFVAMSDILQRPGREELHPLDPQYEASTVAEDDFWSGVVRLSKTPDKKTRLNVALVRSPQGRAKFFDCALTEVEGESTV